ncbi:MAG: HD domain-containing protein [Candidatus Omnitrophica bacterium]|nr:HD domain-containing protein [Candidatus Omnitrophota bacterium]
MRIRYRKELEKTARQMILIHKAETLIRLILRTIVRNIHVKHAGIFIYDKQKQIYVVNVSQGFPEFKIPTGLVKINPDNPIIRYFTDRSLNLPGGILLLDNINAMMRRKSIKKKRKLLLFLEELKFSMSLYQANACIPGFFRDNLVGVLFLGEKKNHKKLDEEEVSFLSVLASDVVMAIKNAWLIEDLNNQLSLNHHLFLQMVSALASSIEAKDKYTIGHTERVADISMIIAEELRKRKRIGNFDKFKEELRIAALLHDIGKIGVPGKVLNKKSKLNDEERKIIMSHPLIGEHILNHISGFNDIVKGVKHHHERYDGKGYPSGLRGRQIPLISSIISLADVFDAMTSDRPYRKRLAFNYVINEIQINRGKQFSPVIVDVFFRSLDKISEYYSTGRYK